MTISADPPFIDQTEFDRVPTTAGQTKTKRPRPRGIGLCLSGGGYRAALFHLGVLRCLHDMGILQKTETISSVSGGSIIAGYVARRMFEENMTSGIAFSDWEAQISSGFRSFVLNDIRTFPVVAHLAWNWDIPNWRAMHLRRKYRRWLTTPATRPGELLLSELPKSPEFIFCATDLTFGINWTFKRSEVGDYQIGYKNSAGWTLAGAVAASSCFPPIFGPISLNLDPKDFKRGTYKGPDKASLMSNLQLTDGGVYDNFGLEPINDNHRTVFISDGGSPFAYSSGRGAVGRLLRYMNVIMKQTASLRKEFFFAGLNSGLHDGSYFGIASGLNAAATPFEGYTGNIGRGIIAGIRTDLDRFCEAESCVLENHGYFVAHSKVMSKAPHLVSDPSYTPVAPHPAWCIDDAVIEGLRKSGSRFSIPRLLGRT